MARDTDTSTATAGLPGGLTGAPTLPTSSTGAPTGTPQDPSAASGLTGKARFDNVLQHPLTINNNGAEFDRWIQSLPEDPNDIEYTRLLRQEKAAAQVRETARSAAASATGANDEPILPWDRGKPPEPGGRIAGRPGKQATAPTVPVITGIKQPVMGANPGAPGPGKMKQDPAEQKEHRETTAGVPLIVGLPVDVGDTGVKPDPNNPGGTPDPFVQQWVNGEDLSVTNDQAKIAAQNGQWVYVGEVADPAGGPGYTRSKYVYVDDAEAQLAGMSDDEIKKYQKQLDMPVTGVVTPDLQALWHKAVQGAQFAARAGKKVELKFLFDQLVAAEAAKGAAGGGGGGGFGNESGADMVGSDYYQAMMAVLGDISGVGK